MNEKIKVSVVSYLNSKPFIHGLEQDFMKDLIEISQDIPSVCAQKLLEDQVDVGLVPVAVIPGLKEHHIISDYCIGAVGKVNSVMLYSNVPLNEIKTILLDYQSRSSVALTRVLAAFFWNIQPEWKETASDYEHLISGNTAAVVIGDRTFGMENKYVYSYDLAEEWQKNTSLPFVFACWVSNKKLPSGFLPMFNKALKFGIDAREGLAAEIQSNNKYQTDVFYYLNNSISYDFDHPKKRALELFLDYTRKLGL